MKTIKQSLNHQFLVAALAALLALVAAPSAFAATKTWVGGYANTGTWNQPSQWAEGAFANTDDVIFTNIVGVSSTATFLSGGRTVKSITFNGGVPSPAFSIRLATSGAGGTAAGLTFISSNTGITVAATDTAAHSIGVSDGSVTLQASVLVTHNGSGTLTINQPITGATFGLTKAGGGTLSLTDANTYSGNTTINAGKLQLVVGGSAVNSRLVLNAATATNVVSITDNTKKWTCANLTTAAAGTLEFNYGAVVPSTTVSPLVIDTNANFTVTPKVRVVVNSGLLPGEYPLLTWGATTGTPPTNTDLTVTTVAAGTAVGLSNSATTLYLVVSSTATSIVKADNTDNLTLGSSWVGGVAPGSANLAKWDSTVTTTNITVLGADMTWAGIAIENPNGPVTINAGNTLTLGDAAQDIDLSAATADLTLDCDLVLGAANIWDVTAGRTLIVAGVVSGNFGFSKLGAGTAILSGTNTYSGSTTLTAGTLQLGATNVIPDGLGKGNVSIAAAGTLDLNGCSETINGLSGAGKVDNLAGSTTATLTTTNNASTTFSGAIRNSGSGSTLNFIKQGSGTLTLSGSNSFSGSTTISGGTLILANDAALDATSGISMAGGTTLTPNLSGIVISAPITVGAPNTSVTITAPDVDGSGTTAFPITFTGAIGGAGNVIFSGINAANGYGTISLNAASTYAGDTLITSDTANNNGQIFVKLGVANALPKTTVLTLDGGTGTGSGRFCDLNLNGKNQTLAGLTNFPGRTLRSQRVNNTSSTAATLTVSNSANYTFSGQMGGGGANLNLAKAGSGTLTLTSATAYSGATTVSGGTLALAFATLAANSTVTVTNGGLLQLNFSTTNSVGALILNGVAQASGVYNSNNVPLYLAGAGSLAVSAAGPSGPATLTNSVTGNVLNLSWPAGQGWRLESQTNALTVGLSTNWVEAAGSSVSSTNITIDPTQPTVFYRLAYP